MAYRVLPYRSSLFFLTLTTSCDLSIALCIRVGVDPLDHSSQPLHATEEEIVGGGDVSKVTQQLVNYRFEFQFRSPDFQPTTLIVISNLLMRKLKEIGTCQKSTYQEQKTKEN